MDLRASVSIVPPAGAPPPLRAKSIRQQRASNGAAIIKTYVQQSEQRREQSKFHATGRLRPGDAPPSIRQDERCEDTAHVEVRPPQACLTERSTTPRANQQQPDTADDAHALDALFSDRRIRRSRRPSASMQGRQTPLQVGGVDSPGVNHVGVKPVSVLRRRLQMETVSTGGHPGIGASGAAGASIQGYRQPTALLVPHHPRARHNLGAKLDALAKTSMLNRRKVVFAGDEKAVKNLVRNLSPRHPTASGNESHHEVRGAESEAESRVMAAFRQIVRLWRERKRRAEAAALTRMNGNASGIATGTGRNGSKLRKDLTAQQSNVVGIISKRLIREIPALKFFDEETETQHLLTTGNGSGATPKPVVSAVVPELSKPRGVCYTLDAFGCRKIKMQSSTTIADPSRPLAANASSHNQQKTRNEAFTLEKAMHRSLHRKMTRRLKSRRQSILRLGDDFSKARNDLAMKLRSQLALQQAQMEKMFSKRLTLLMTDDTTLPPYQAQKELHLARVRCKKANLLEKCETLRVLALVLKHVEARGIASGLEVSTGELHFLDLFRCVVEEDHILTPIISNAIRQHMRSQDLRQPLIMELFEILDREMHGRQHTEQHE